MTAQELKESLEEARRRNVSLWDVLLVEKRVSEETLAESFAALLKLPYLRIASASVEPEAIRAIGLELARKYLCLPLKIEGKSLVLAMANPWDCDMTRRRAIRLLKHEPQTSSTQHKEVQGPALPGSILQQLCSARRSHPYPPHLSVVNTSSRPSTPTRPVA